MKSLPPGGRCSSARSGIGKVLVLTCEKNSDHLENVKRGFLRKFSRTLLVAAGSITLLACHGVRTFFTGGHFAVTVFFMISGYVLLTKPLMLIHAGEYVKLGNNLVSALFGRWLRLHIPVICTTFLYMTSWHAFGLWTDNEPQSNYRDELWKWYTEFKNFGFVFNTGGDPWFPYDIRYSQTVHLRPISTSLPSCSRPWSLRHIPRICRRHIPQNLEYY